MIVVAKLNAREGKEGEVEKALSEMIPRVEKEEGTLTYKFHRALENPKLFLFYEKYRDKAALDYHMNTPYFKELFDKIGPLLAGEPIIEMYEEISGIKDKS